METYLLNVAYLDQNKVFRLIAIPKVALISKFVEFMAESFDLYKEETEDYFVWGHDENKNRWKITSDEIANALPFKRKQYNLEKILSENQEFITVVQQQVPYVFSVKLVKKYKAKTTELKVIEQKGEIEQTDYV